MLRFPCASVHGHSIHPAISAVNFSTARPRTSIHACQTGSLRSRVALGCCDRSKLCDRCLADELAHMRGVAANRGEVWSTSVAARIARRDPWPAFEGRARELALKKTADLGPDQRLHEQLAIICHEWAARRWAQLGSQSPIVASRYVAREGRRGRIHTGASADAIGAATTHHRTIGVQPRNGAGANRDARSSALASKVHPKKR